MQDSRDSSSTRNARFGSPITVMQQILLGALGAGLLTACGTKTEERYTGTTARFSDGVFHNTVAREQLFSPLERLQLWWAMAFDKPAGTVPSAAPPVHRLTQRMLQDAPDGSLYRLGHSSVLLKIGGKFWLTDPVFSERVSPVQWLGPKRFHAPPITLDELPPLEAVILSHDHYDHLDRATIVALKDRASHFLAPLGVGDLIIEWGVAPDKVRQLDWWQATEVGPVRFVATPAQHFSGRSPLGGNQTLWASWVMLADDFRIFFSGDSGYFDGFKEIGERYGPFDLTLIETGAYDTRWSYVHMLPEQTLQAHRDLRGKWMLPIQNSTFDLAFHPWDQPMEQVTALAAQDGLRVSTPHIGERLDLRRPHPGIAWWRADRDTVVADARSVTAP